jgi:Skp family chaperone for outer membrane proteins
MRLAACWPADQLSSIFENNFKPSGKFRLSPANYSQNVASRKAAEKLKGRINGNSHPKTRYMGGRTMLKKGLIAAGGLAMLLGLVFGRDMTSYVKTTVGWVNSTVKDAVPVQFELERARKMIQGLGPEISRHKREIAREELDLRKLAAQVQQDEQKLAKNWSEIETLKGDLSRGDSNFVYAGHTYTVKQVETDLTNRFERYRTREATMQKLNMILAARQRGLDAAQEKLKAMIAAKRQLEVEVENLEARLKMVEVAKASSEFHIDDSQLSRTRQLLSDIESRIEVDAQLVNADDLVLDEIPVGTSTEPVKILDQIAEYEKSKGQEPGNAKLVGVEK